MTDLIVPRVTRTVDFYGDELVAVRDAQGTIWIPLRSMCDAIGVDYSAQYQRIQRDPIMTEELALVELPGADGRTRSMTCLPLKYVRAWLFGINATRVRAQIREKLLQYQREVIEIIDRAFTPALPARDLDDDLILAMRESSLQQARLWEQIYEIRQRQHVTETVVQELDDRVMEHDHAIRHLLAEVQAVRGEQGRLAARLNDAVQLLPPAADPILPHQKAAIKAMVDDIVAAAQRAGTRLGQGRNDYPAVWDAFKRRFDLAKYDELTGERYEEAITWLKAWRDRLDAH